LEEKQTFSKEERLKSRKIISQLFRSQQSLGHYPFRMLWMEVPQPLFAENPLIFALSVPKKKFKHAVDRNLLRRRIREAYRLNKSEFYATFPKENKEQVAIMVIYTADEPLPYSRIEDSLKKMFLRFHKIRNNKPKGA
jgi:ribonuclease P protein component